jgi:uncharacterized membrane protein
VRKENWLEMVLGFILIVIVLLNVLKFVQLDREIVNANVLLEVEQ